MLINILKEGGQIFSQLCFYLSSQVIGDGFRNKTRQRIVDI